MKILVVCMFLISFPLHSMDTLLNPDASFVRKAQRKLYEHLGAVQRHSESGCRLIYTGACNACLNSVVDFPRTSVQLALHVADLIEFFKRRHAPFNWSIAQYLEPSNLSESFLKHGIKLQSSSPGLLIDLEVFARSIEQNQHLSIEKVMSDSELLKWPLILQQSFGIDETSAKTYISLFRSPNQDKHFTHLACKVNGEMVSIGTLLATSRGGYIYNIATRPDQRKKGYASALVCKLLAIAKGKGLSRVGLIAVSQEAASMYAKLGFRAVCMINTYEQPG